MTEPLFYLRGHSTGVSSVSFLNQDLNLLSADQSGVVHLWNMKEKVSKIKIDTKLDSILHATPLPNNQFVTQHRLGEIALWDFEKPTPLSTIHTNSLSFATLCTLDAERQIFLSPSSEDGVVLLIDFRSPHPTPFLKPLSSVARNKNSPNALVALSYPLNSPILSSQQQQAHTLKYNFLVVLESSEVAHYDIRNPSQPGVVSPPLFTLLQQPTAAINVQPSVLWMGSANGTIAHCSLLKKLEKGRGGGKVVMENTASSLPQIGTGGEKEEINIHVKHLTELYPRRQPLDSGASYDDAADRVPSAAPEELQFQMGISQFAVRKDARIVIGGCWDNRVRIFESVTRRLLGVLSGHTGPVLSVSFGNKYGVFAASSRDGRISVWNTYADSMAG